MYSMDATLREHFKTETKVPDSAKMIRLYKQDQPWSISLLLYRDEIKEIKNRKDLVINESSITLYFPFQGKYYGKKVNNKKSHGFTIRDLVKGGQKLALKLMGYVAETDSQVFSGKTSEEIVAGYGIFGVKISGNKVFLVVKHKDNQ